MGEPIRELKIADLKSPTLQGVAAAIDYAHNQTDYGKLTGKEFEDLQNKLNGDAALKAELEKETADVKALFGYTSSNPSKQVVDKPVEAKQLSKKEQKAVEDNVVALVTKLANDKQDAKSIKESLLKEFGQQYTYDDATGDHEVGDYKTDSKGNILPLPEYKAVLDKTFALLDAVTSKDADFHYDWFGFKHHNDAHKAIKKAAKADGTWKGFTKKIITALEKVNQNEKVEQRYNKMAAEYDKKIADEYKAHKDNKTYVASYEDALDDTKKVMKDSKEWRKDKYARKAYHKLEDHAEGKATTRAREIMYDTATTQESKREIRSDLRDLSKDDVFRDGIQNIKADRDVQASKNERNNRKAEIQSVKYDDAVKALGQDLVDKLRVYRNGDKFNFARLSDDIASRAGFDGQISRNDHDREMAEIRWIGVKLQDVTGKTFTDSEIKTLRKYCKIDYEHKDRSAKSIAMAALGGVPGAITTMAAGILSGIAAATGSYEVFQAQFANLDGMSEQEAYDLIASKLNDDFMSGELSKLSDEELTELVENIVKENGGSADDIVAQLVTKHFDYRQLNGIRGALISAIPAALNILVPALMVLAFGKDKDEKSCVSVSDYALTEKNYTNAERFKKHIENCGYSQTKTDAMKMLVDTCYEKFGDNWHQVYNDLVRTMAGYGSKLNPKECLGFLAQGGIDWSKYKQWEKPAPAPVQPAPEPQPAPVAPQKPKCTGKITSYIKMPDSNKYGWKEIVMMFYGDCIQNKQNPYNDPNYSRIVGALKKYNKINAKTVHHVPAGIVLPPVLTFKDGVTCERTERQNIKRVSYTAYDGVDGKTGAMPSERHTADKTCGNNTTRVGEFGTYNEAKEALRKEGVDI